jgi:hypothetical protein
MSEEEENQGLPDHSHSFAGAVSKLIVEHVGEL